MAGAMDQGRANAMLVDATGTRVGAGEALPGRAPAQGASNGKTTGAARFRLPGGPEAPAQARRLVLALDADLSPDVRRDLSLVLSEIVTNAVVHGGAGEQDEVDIDIVATPGGLAVCVHDGGTGLRAAPYDPQREGGGLGLATMARLVESWGMQHDGTGTSVWFHLPSSDGRPMAPAVPEAQALRQVG
jgi:anti-sigma regulatory factor (Ser/Thr protein kinase)